MPTAARDTSVGRDELLDFVRPRHHLILGTTRQDGRVQLSPVTGGVDAQGRVVVSSYPDRAKTANLRRDPRATVLFLSVEEIAEAAMVSPRTFYRYFGTKEAVLYDGQDDQLALLHDVITSQPPEEPPLAAVRAGVLVLARQAAATAELSLRRARISGSTSSLGEYQRTALAPRWEEALTRAVAERLGVDPAADVRPLLLAGIGLTVMAAVTETFRRDGTADLEGVVLAHFADLTDLVAEQSNAPDARQAATEPRAGAR